MNFIQVLDGWMVGYTDRYIDGQARPDFAELDTFLGQHFVDPGTTSLYENVVPNPKSSLKSDTYVGAPNPDCKTKLDIHCKRVPQI